MVTACLTACPCCARPDALQTIVANAGKKEMQGEPAKMSLKLILKSAPN